jgi:hypothetical protein
MTNTETEKPGEIVVVHNGTFPVESVLSEAQAQADRYGVQLGDRLEDGAWEGWPMYRWAVAA